MEGWTGFCLPKPGPKATSGPGGHRAKIKWPHPQRCRAQRADRPGRVPLDAIVQSTEESYFSISLSLL